MASKTKQTQELVDGTEVTTTKDGWKPNEVASFPVLMQGWNAGSPSHHSISAGMALACKDVDGAYLGDFEAIDAKGEPVNVPVYDPKVINLAMQEAFIEKYDLDVQTIRIAGNRTAAKAELSAIQASLAADPAVMKALETSNPELFAKLSDM